MPTQRYEGATLEDAMQAAVRELGPAAHFVGANRVRKGGLAGFFAHEHVEVEVEFEAPAEGQVKTQGQAPPGRQPSPGPPTQSRLGAAGRDGKPVGNGLPAPGAGPKRTRPVTESSKSVRPDGFLAHGDPMTELLEEMAGSGPSSVLDLAEQVNNQQSRFSLQDVSFAPGAPNPPSSANQNEGAENAFATVLERIAKEAGLVPADSEPIDPGDGNTFEAPIIGEPLVVAHHTDALLAELDKDHELLPEPAGPRPLTDLGMALHDLGLPLPACQSVMPAADRDSLRRELVLVLREYIAEVPPAPRTPSSVVAVVGPRGDVMRTARALASEMGTAEDEIALATTRKVWRQEGNFIDGPTAAMEQRRSWRWRKRPSVVAIEQEIRPSGSPWAMEVLRALEPTIAWGVVPAAHKPEDIAAWSGSLGGLDVIALVDLDGTTTPAAALASCLPIGRLDDSPGTADQWAEVLCHRLLG